MAFNSFTASSSDISESSLTNELPDNLDLSAFSCTANPEVLFEDFSIGSSTRSIPHSIANSLKTLAGFSSNLILLSQYSAFSVNSAESSTSVGLNFFNCSATSSKYRNL